MKLTYTQVIPQGPPGSSVLPCLKEQRGGCWDYSPRHPRCGHNTDRLPADRALPEWSNADLGFRLFEGIR